MILSNLLGKSAVFQNKLPGTICALWQHEDELFAAVELGNGNIITTKVSHLVINRQFYIAYLSHKTEEKIKAIKVVRELKHFDLKEAKDLVESNMCKVPLGRFLRKEAEELKEKVSIIHGMEVIILPSEG